jgi:hypothetical protein
MNHGKKSCAQLLVADARLEDVAAGRARLSRKVLDALRLEPGDMVRIHGHHPILATAAEAAPEDEGLDLVRLDATLRHRAGIEVGQQAEVCRYDVRTAQAVRLAVLGDADGLDLSPEAIREILGPQALVVGDAIAAAPRRKHFEAQVNVLGLNIAGIEGSTTECGAVLLRVLATSPRGVVRVAPDTQIELVVGGASDVEESAGAG